MAKVTPFNMEAAAKGKKIPTKAEYAVADAINRLRFKGGSCNNVGSVPFDKWANHEEVKHNGSYLFTTDQMADHLMGEAWFTRESRASRFDTDNTDRDIDLIMADRWTLSGKMTTVKEYKNEGKRITFSVKRSNIACSSGKVSIELFTFNHLNENMKRDGWIESGESTYTVFAIGHKAVVCTTKLLKELVGRKSMVHTIYPHLTPELIQRNIEEKRTYTDSCNMAVPITDLIEMCEGKVIDLPEWYTKAWDKSATDKNKAGNKSLWNI